MTEEEPQQQSIQARIAALNLGQVGRAPITATTSPRPAPKPSLDFRRASTNIPTRTTNSIYSNGVGNEPSGPNRPAVLPPPIITRTGQVTGPSTAPVAPPRLPPRKNSSQQPERSPALPPRRPSEQLSRRDSDESMSSVVSTISTTSAFSNGPARTPTSRAPSMDAGRRLQAPVYDPATLPPLPPKRPKAGKEKESARLPLRGAKSTPTITTIEVHQPPATPPLPQRPNGRDQSREPARRLPPTTVPPPPARQIPRPTATRVNGLDNHQDQNATPPPIPLSSRPDLSRLLATKPKPSSTPSPSGLPTTPSTNSCLKCRDFSAPDTHAATFPRHTVPSIDWLASQLTTPFPSPTDKARAIFTWLHHNVDYDTEAFFNDRVQPSSPISTLNTGLAVCEGYAALFTALATHAGLASVVVGGHGKGFGFAALPRGAHIPPESSNHAWNAVQIDNGEWKLLDACWGAGNVQGKGLPYQRAFKPNHFTMDNEEFGLSHFPSNRAHFYLPHGGTVSWEEYILGDQGGPGVRVFTNMAPQEGLSTTKFLPKYLKVPVSAAKHAGPTVRFQFERVCSHWDPLVHGPGKPYQFILAVHGRDGRADDYVPFETNGLFWWADVPPEKLGAPGQTITCFVVDTVAGNSGRGLSREEYLAAKGRKGMSFQGVAAWELI